MDTLCGCYWIPLRRKCCSFWSTRANIPLMVFTQIKVFGEAGDVEKMLGCNWLSAAVSLLVWFFIQFYFLGQLLTTAANENNYLPICRNLLHLAPYLAPNGLSTCRASDQSYSTSGCHVFICVSFCLSPAPTTYSGVMRDVQQELKPTSEKHGWYTSNFLSLADFTNSPFLGWGEVLNSLL